MVFVVQQSVQCYVCWNVQLALRKHWNQENHTIHRWSANCVDSRLNPENQPFSYPLERLQFNRSLIQFVCKKIICKDGRIEKTRPGGAIWRTVKRTASQYPPKSDFSPLSRWKEAVVAADTTVVIIMVKCADDDDDDYYIEYRFFFLRSWLMMRTIKHDNFFFSN